MADWIDWPGGWDLPVPGMTPVDVQLRDGRIREDWFAHEWSWYHFNEPTDIVKYRLRETDG